MINLFFILLMLIVILSNLYVFKFQRSREGKDERGQTIQLKTISSMYNALFVSSAVLIVLNLIDVLDSEQTVNFWLYLLVLVSVYGAFILYKNKKD